MSFAQTDSPTLQRGGFGPWVIFPKKDGEFAMVYMQTLIRYPYKWKG